MQFEIDPQSSILNPTLYPRTAASFTISAMNELRTSGPENTALNPNCSPYSLYSAKTSGCTYSSTGKWARVGCKYWPIVATSTSDSLKSSSNFLTSPRVSPSPTMNPDLVSTPGEYRLAASNKSSDCR